MLTPLDIHNKEFKRGFRGYNEEEVDEFLDRVIKDYEQLYRENIDLKENIERLNTKVDHFKHLENTLHNTLVVAQETAEGVRAAAKKEAELIVKEAQATAQKMIYDTEEKVKETATDCDKIKKQEQAIRAQIKNLLLTQLELLKSSEEQPAYQDKIID